MERLHRPAQPLFRAGHTHSTLAPWIEQKPLFVRKHLTAARLGVKMSLPPVMIAVWCRKVCPLALWEDHAHFKGLIDQARGHTKLINIADNYRATHNFWPSLPQLFELALGPPTADARALRRQTRVLRAAASEFPDPELTDWGEAEPLGQELQVAQPFPRPSAVVGQAPQAKQRGRPRGRPSTAAG